MLKMEPSEFQPEKVSAVHRKLIDFFPGLNFLEYHLAAKSEKHLSSLRRESVKHGKNLSYAPREPSQYLQESLALQHALGELKGKRVLHLAGGHGLFSKILSEAFGAKATSIDLSLVHSKLGQKQFETQTQVVAKAGNLPLKDESMDAVVSDHFLNSGYLMLSNAHERRILREAFRVLKPGGALVISKAYKESLSYLPRPADRKVQVFDSVYGDLMLIRKKGGKA